VQVAEVSLLRQGRGVLMVSTTSVDSYSGPFLNRAPIGALRERLVAEVASLQLSANFGARPW
jgi:hypothetical protein